MRKNHKKALTALVRYNFNVERASVNNVMSQMMHDHLVKEPWKLSQRKVKRWLSKLVKEGFATKHQDYDTWLYTATKRGRREYDLFLGSS